MKSPKLVLALSQKGAPPDFSESSIIQLKSPQIALGKMGLTEDRELHRFLLYF